MTYLTRQCAAGHEYVGWCRPCNAAAARRYRARHYVAKPPRVWVIRPALERFVEKVDATGDCWEWTGTRSLGYGRFMVSNDRHMTWAHRAAWELLVGPIPDGLQLDHLCRNRGCVNPDHLEPVTSRLNTLRSPIGAGAKARVTHCPAGHEYTAENTRRSKRNQRTCRACDSLGQRRRNAAKRDRAA